MIDLEVEGVAIGRLILRLRHQNRWHINVFPLMECISHVNGEEAEEAVDIVVVGAFVGILVIDGEDLLSKLWVICVLDLPEAH